MTCDGGIKGRTHWDVESEFCWSNWVGMYTKLETRLTHELHRLERFNQIAYRFRTIGPSSVLCRSGSHTFVATLCLLRCCLFYFRLIYNEWFVTKSSRSSWSNTAGVLKRTSVSACWGILNLFITLLPIRKRAEIELWEIDVIGLIRLDLYLRFLPWLRVLLTPQIEYRPLHAQYQFWLPTGFFGSRDSCLLLAAWTSTVH